MLGSARPVASGGQEKLGVVKMHSQDSPCERITYDSSDAKLQWRCNLYAARHPMSLLMVGAVFFILATVAHLSFFFGLAAVLSLLTISLAQMTVTVNKRVKSPRICTTTIDAEGLTDLTPDGEKTIPWSRIKRVEMSRGDIYFITWSGGAFIPASAYESQSDALNYYKKAQQMWLVGKSGRNQKLLSSSRDKSSAALRDKAAAREVEALLAEEDSVWKDLEEQHKKQQGTGTRGEDAK